MRRRAFTTALLFAIVGASLRAHDGAHLELTRLETHLASEPDDVAARLDRALLHREHDDLGAALEDLDHAATLAPDEPRLAWVAACIDADLGFYDSALVHVNAWLAQREDDVDGAVLRARLHARTDQLDASLEDYGRALAATPFPNPTWFVERARVEQRLERDALASLDDGLALYATHPDLLEVAFELSLAGGEFARAEAHLATLERHFAGRTSQCLMLRGDLCAARDDHAGARRAYEAALEALDSRAAGRGRASTADTTLRRALRDRLERLEEMPEPPTEDGDPR